MTNAQLYLAIGIPMLFNAAWVAVLIGMLSAKMDAKFEAIDQRFATCVISGVPSCIESKKSWTRA